MTTTDLSRAERQYEKAIEACDAAWAALSNAKRYAFITGMENPFEYERECRANFRQAYYRKVSLLDRVLWLCSATKIAA